MTLPDNYKEWIERVSNVVEFVYPFEWEAKQRYLDWLFDNVPENRKRGFSINEDEYLEEAQKVWTFIHLQMEHYLLWEPLDVDDILYELHIDEINHWIKYIDSLDKDWRTFETEVYVCDEKNRFQWAMDVRAVHYEKKLIKLFDWKTWWIAKKRYGLPNNYAKPYSKLKKLTLQLSLYAETDRQKWYTIEWIYWVWLHESWAYEYSLTPMTTEELDEILLAFKRSKWETIPYKLNIKNNMENNKVSVELYTPTWEQYEMLRFISEVNFDEVENTIENFIEMKNSARVKLAKWREDFNKYLEWEWI